MKLENQVVSLELAKKLKELGVLQDGAFYWKASNDTLKYDDGSLVEIETELLFGKTPVFKTLGTWEPYTAYTVAELGEMLAEADPDVIQLAYNHLFNVESSRFITTTGLQLLLVSPDRCAQMLIYLLENQLITL